MVLAKKLPPTHRVILVERNSHFNREYAVPHGREADTMR